VTEGKKLGDELSLPPTKKGWAPTEPTLPGQQINPDGRGEGLFAPYRPFFGFGLVSTTVIEGRLSASLTGM